MDILQQMNLFRIGFIICLVIMAAGFGLAVFFFIKFKIPKAIALLNGTARDKSVSEMKRSGVLRNPKDVEKERSNSAKLRYQDKTEDYRTEDIKDQAEVLKEEGAGVSMNTEYFSAADEDPVTSVLTARGEVLTTVLKDDQKTGGRAEEGGAGKTQILQRQVVTFEAAELPKLSIDYRIIEHTAIVHTEEFI